LQGKTTYAEALDLMPLPFSMDLGAMARLRRSRHAGQRLTEGGDDFNLLVAEENIHGANPLGCCFWT
jgi:hypothetical protein